MTGSTINKRLNPKMESIQPVTHCPKLDLKTKALEDQNMKKRGRKRKRITCSSSRRAKKSKIEPLIITTEKCCFCLMGPDKEKGTFFQDQNSNIAAHQFCLLFSAGLPQAGEDNEGFEGFLVADILKEVQRVSKLICKFCGRNGANLGCCVQHCRSIYHFNCGYKEGLQFQFCGSFDTYCHVHRSHQDLSLVRTKPKHQFCPICLENFSSVPLVSSETVLKTPCCNNVFVHKECVQRQASVAGYFFRCPCCNNKDEFGDEMAKYGIYIPSRDAAWEESNAYNDLLQEYDKCDFNNCSCTRGRKYSTQAGKWHLLRCYLCGQSAVHVKCLGRCYIPGIGYVCATCNKVAKLNKENIETVQQQSYTERLKEHKRRLNLLKARNDPVLLASEVFSKEILRKKFNIVNDCKVRLRRLDINIKSRKMKLSTALKFLQTPNENKTHLVTTKSVLAPVRKSPRKSPLKSLIQVQPKKLGVNTNYMFRDRGSRGENMWLESQSDLSEINSTTSKTNNENKTHKVISNEDGDCHSVIDPNNNQFVNKNLEKEELDNESPKGSTADTQDMENIVESLKQTELSRKIDVDDWRAVVSHLQERRKGNCGTDCNELQVEQSKFVFPEVEEITSNIKLAERLKSVAVKHQETANYFRPRESKVESDVSTITGKFDSQMMRTLKSKDVIVSDEKVNESFQEKIKLIPPISKKAQTSTKDAKQPKKSKTSIAEESKHVLKSIKSEMLSPRNRENQNIETRPSSTLSKNTNTTIKSIQQQYLSPRAIPTIHTTIRSGAVPTMRLKPQSPFKVVWSPNMKVSLDDFLNSPQTPGRCFLGFDMDLKPIYCDKCNFCVTPKTSTKQAKLTSTKSISTLSELSESKLVADGKTKTSITQNVPYASVTKNATSFTPRLTRASSIRSKKIMTESPLTPDCCFLGFDSELKPVFCEECKIASPSARTTGPCSKQRNFLTPMKTDFADSKFGGFINKENLMTSRKQLYRPDERKYIPVPCLDIKQLIGKNPDDEKYTKIWTPYQDCSQFFRSYSYRDAKVGCGSDTRSNDIAMALLEEAFENDDELVIAVESG